MAYAYQATVTVPAPTGGPHTNFTLCIKGSDTLLKLASLGTGGAIQNSTTRAYTGYTQTVPADLVLSTDAAVTSLMTWGIDTWDSANGIIYIWVKIPSYSAGFTIYVSIGNISVTTYQGGSIGSEFDSSTQLVWHLPNGSSLNAADFSANGNSGTITNATATTGKVDGGADMSPSQAKIAVSSATGLPVGSTASFTLEGWHNTTTYESLGVYFGFGNPDSGLDVKGGERYVISYNNHYYLWGDIDGSHLDADWDTGIAFDTDGAWHHWAFTANGSTLKFFLDGVQKASTTRPTSWTTVSSVVRSGYATTWSVTLAAKLDEERIISTDRSANWIATEVANQSSIPVMSAFSGSTIIKNLTELITITETLKFAISIQKSEVLSIVDTLKRYISTTYHEAITLLDVLKYTQGLNFHEVYTILERFTIRNILEPFLTYFRRYLSDVSTIQVPNFTPQTPSTTPTDPDITYFRQYLGRI